MSFSTLTFSKETENQKATDKALLNPNSPIAEIRSLTTKLSLAYADIKDAINTNLAFREHQAVNKIRDNPKYFFSYAKKFSRQIKSRQFQCFLMKMAQSAQKLKK